MKEFPDEIYILIEDYLLQQLSDDKRKKVELRIETDPEFAKEVKWMQFATKELSDPKAAKILKDFQEIHQANRQTKTTEPKNIVSLNPSPNKTRPFLLAASFLLIATISFFTLFDKKVEQIQPIAEKHASPNVSWKEAISYDLGQQLLGNGDLADRGLAFLSDGNIDQALSLLEQYLVEAATSEEGIDYNIKIEVGKIYLNKGEFSKAIQSFQSVIQSNAVFSYIIKAEYHLGIAYWAAGQKKQAVDVLTRLAKNGRKPWNTKSRFFLVQEGIEIE